LLHSSVSTAEWGHENVQGVLVIAITARLVMTNTTAGIRFTLPPVSETQQPVFATLEELAALAPAVDATRTDPLVTLTTLACRSFCNAPTNFGYTDLMAAIVRSRRGRRRRFSERHRELR